MGEIRDKKNWMIRKNGRGNCENGQGGEMVRMEGVGWKG